jgi:hypothetical protein
LAHLDFGHLDFGHLDFGQLDFGHLDFGQLDFGHLDFGHLDFGHFDFGHLDFVPISDILVFAHFALAPFLYSSSRIWLWSSSSTESTACTLSPTSFSPSYMQVNQYGSNWVTRCQSYEYQVQIFFADFGQKLAFVLKSNILRSNICIFKQYFDSKKSFFDIFAENISKSKHRS